jgi:hypothetical protein
MQIQSTGLRNEYCLECRLYLKPCEGIEEEVTKNKPLCWQVIRSADRCEVD